jgi:hypothetical protein
MPLKMLMDSMSIPLFRVISPCLTLHSRDREQVPRGLIRPTAENEKGWPNSVRPTFFVRDAKQAQRSDPGKAGQQRREGDA